MERVLVCGMSDLPDAIVERDGHVLTVTLNRPQAKNALQRRDARRRVRRLEAARRGPRAAGRHPHRRRRRLLLGHGPQGAGRRHRPSRGRERMSRGPRPALEGAAAPLPADASRSSPPSRATAWPAAPRSSRPPRSGWRARAPSSASPRSGAACSRSAAPPCGSSARSPTPTPPTCCSPAGSSPPRRPRTSGLIGHVVPDGQALDQGPRARRPDRRQRPLAVQRRAQVASARPPR